MPQDILIDEYFEDILIISIAKRTKKRIFILMKKWIY